MENDPAGELRPKSAQDRILFALDVPTEAEAYKYVNVLAPEVGGFKIGMELFIAAGPRFVKNLTVERKLRVMLDLKLHDIPETVERAARAASALDVAFLSVHVQQRESMSRAAKVAAEAHVQLLGVTLLTSMTARDCDDLRFNDATCNPAMRAGYLAGFAWQAGVTGLVASPQDVGTLRKKYPTSMLVCPGVRPAGAKPGDQKRTGTPGQAVRDGADYVVVGRPILDAENPVMAARMIAAEIATQTAARSS